MDSLKRVAVTLACGVVGAMLGFFVGWLLAAKWEPGSIDLLRLYVGPAVGLGAGICAGQAILRAREGRPPDSSS